jgi:CBS domain-containing protein
MWWPAIGAIAVGAIGYVAPRTLGVGYDNIEQIVAGKIVGVTALVLCTLKFISWAVALGSGTSGGTLAPLFTIGGGLGSILGAVVAGLAPSLGVDPRIAALVGMASMFAGASRALLASVIFAFETTQQPFGLLPLLGGCTAAFMVSCFLLRNSIMTEKIARRGARVLGDYAVDFLDQLLVRDVAVRAVVSLHADDSLETVRAWVASRVPGTSHQGFPVLDGRGGLVGVVTRRSLLDPTIAGTLRVGDVIQQPPVVALESSSLREAADLMVRENIGRLPVVSERAPGRVTGIITRSDLLRAHQRRLDEASVAEQVIVRKSRVAA